MAYNYLFGPVPSRRLGISLGVDLVPAKVCSFNCIYCEVGITTQRTLERRDYIPAGEIIAELDDCLAASPQLDYITFSGAGEPTLNSGIGRIIAHLKDQYPGYRLALITNSSLFDDAQLRAEIAAIDLILPSLDAVSASVFQRLNRPHQKLDISAIIAGLTAFRQESQAEMWLEIFLSPGLNNTEAELTQLKKVCQRIGPNRVQLNSLDRPGLEAGLRPMSAEEMDQAAAFLRPLPVEIIARAASRADIASHDQDIEQRILDTIRRRPCTDKDLAASFGLHINELNKYLGSLLDRGLIREQREERGIFFEPAGKK